MNSFVPIPSISCLSSLQIQPCIFAVCKLPPLLLDHGRAASGYLQEVPALPRWQLIAARRAGRGHARPGHRPRTPGRVAGGDRSEEGESSAEDQAVEDDDGHKPEGEGFHRQEEAAVAGEIANCSRKP